MHAQQPPQPVVIPVQSNVRNRVDNNVRNRVDNNVRNRVDNNVRNNVRNNVNNDTNVRNNVNNETRVRNDNNSNVNNRNVNDNTNSNNLSDFNANENVNDNDLRDFSTDNSVTSANTESSSNNNVQTTIRQGNLLNITNEARSDTFFRYRGGTQVPTAVLNSDIAVFGSEVFGRVGISIPIGGNRDRAIREVELDSTLRQATFCSNLVAQGVEIDLEQRPELAFCNGFTARVPPVMPESNEIALLKKQMEDQIAALKQAQLTNKALQMRLIQMQNAPKEVKASY